MQRGDEESARKALSRLEVLDNPFYYKHRLSRVELTFGHLPEALAAAREAVQGSKAPFEALANLIYCEVKSSNLTEAAALLDKLDSQFGNLRRDIRVALRCSFEVARGNYSDALLQSDRIVDKHTIFYKRIRYDALVGEVRHSALTDEIREKYSSEADALLEEFREAGKPTNYVELDQF